MSAPDIVKSTILHQTSIGFKNHNDISVAIFDEVFSKNTYCALLSITINCDLNISIIKKVCKLCAKRNIDLYYTGPRTFEDLFSKYKETYKIQYKIYASKIEKSSEITEKALCKRKSDTITLKAPADRSKRLKFLLDKASELVAGYSCTPKTIDNLIPNSIKNYSNDYAFFFRQYCYI